MQRTPFDWCGSHGNLHTIKAKTNSRMPFNGALTLYDAAEQLIVKKTALRRRAGVTSF